VVAREADLARELAELSGGLPLALSLMGNYLRLEAFAGQPRRVHAALERLRDARERMRLSQSRAVVDRSPSLHAGEPLSLWTAIGASDRHLLPSAQTALRALAVFPPKPSGFSEEAAVVVGGAPTATLDALSDAGLLENVGIGRYTLHRTVTDYARVALYDVEASKRMAAYYVALAERHAQDAHILKLETSNIVAALQAADAHDIRAEYQSGRLAPQWGMEA
jgi:hypothetical protein